METVLRFTTLPSQCGYLPEQVWRMEYEQVAAMTPAEYEKRLLQNWRRFGHMLFRPRCRACNACRSLRVVVNQFRPDRSQRRCRQMNEGIVKLRIGQPSVTPEKLELYDRYHAYQSETKGWPWHEPKDAEEYAASFVLNPFPTQEWCYYVGNRLVGVGYVDDLPAGLSAIYFFYDPEERNHGLGTWNILSMIQYAATQRLPHVYLGYYVEGCPSMTYKGRFVANQIFGGDGRWRDFRT